MPGLRGHVEDHWQTRLAAKLPHAVVVPSFGRAKRDLAGRVADLHHVIQQAGAPVTIVAHSAGVLTTLHWARQHDLPVRGALLATPPDLARPLGPEYPTLEQLEESGWLPIPLAPLNFPSIVAASTNDPLSDFENVRTLAEAWGSQLHRRRTRRPPQPRLRLRRLARSRGPAPRPARHDPGTPQGRPRRLTPGLGPPVNPPPGRRRGASRTGGAVLALSAPNASPLPTLWRFGRAASWHRRPAYRTWLGGPSSAGHGWSGSAGTS